VEWAGRLFPFLEGCTSATVAQSFRWWPVRHCTLQSSVPTVQHTYQCQCQYVHTIALEPARGSAHTSPSMRWTEQGKAQALHYRPSALWHRLHRPACSWGLALSFSGTQVVGLANQLTWGGVVRRPSKFQWRKQPWKPPAAQQQGGGGESQIVEIVVALYRLIDRKGTGLRHKARAAKELPAAYWKLRVLIALARANGRQLSMDNNRGMALVRNQQRVRLS
jgi:hypothetical protein